NHGGDAGVSRPTVSCPEWTSGRLAFTHVAAPAGGGVAPPPLAGLFGPAPHPAEPRNDPKARIRPHRPQPQPGMAVSNPDKVFFPQVGLTKGDLVSYYLDVADCALPHLRNRPFHMVRYPNGVAGNFFHQKRVPAHPDFVGEQFVQFPSGHSTVF